MSYCTNKNKAIVKWFFADKKEKIFETDNLPIEVVTEMVNNT